jgi:hypothetical protein
MTGDTRRRGQGNQLIIGGEARDNRCYQEMRSGLSADNWEEGGQG